MAELYENKEAARERVILVGVCTRENENVEESLDELKELADTAGAEAVGRVIQNRESMHPGTYIGSGKIDEVRELAAELHADGVICDDELTPAQLRGLEQELETVAEANSCFKELGFTDVDITQIQAAKAKKVGPYEMMMGQNPVYIFAGTGKGEA